MALAFRCQWSAFETERLFVRAESGHRRKTNEDSRRCSNCQKTLVYLPAALVAVETALKSELPLRVEKCKSPSLKKDTHSSWSDELELRSTSDARAISTDFSGSFLRVFL